MPPLGEPNGRHSDPLVSPWSHSGSPWVPNLSHLVTKYSHFGSQMVLQGSQRSMKQQNTSPRQQKTPSIQINTPTRKKHLEVFFSLRGKINTSKRNKHLEVEKTPRSQKNTSRCFFHFEVFIYSLRGVYFMLVNEHGFCASALCNFSCRNVRIYIFRVSSHTARQLSSINIYQ